MQLAMRQIIVLATQAYERVECLAAIRVAASRAAVASAVAAHRGIGNAYTKRLLRRWYTSNKHGRRLFPAEVLCQFDGILCEGTQQHRAGLGLAIEVALPTRALLHRISSRARANALFQQHQGLRDDAPCNVLIYINLADRKVEIITDKPLESSQDAAPWRFLCDQISAGFMQGDPVNAITQALHDLNRHLMQQQGATDVVCRSGTNKHS